MSLANVQVLCPGVSVRDSSKEFSVISEAAAALSSFVELERTDKTTPYVDLGRGWRTPMALLMCFKATIIRKTIDITFFSNIFLLQFV